MNKEILAKIRKLNWVLQEPQKGGFSFMELCAILSELMDANAYISNVRGKVLGVHYAIEADSAALSDPETGVNFFPIEYSEELMKVTETVYNISPDEAMNIFKYEYDTAGKYHMIIPIMGGGQHWGTVVLVRYEPPFDEIDIALGEYGATVVGLEIQRQKSMEIEEEERKRSVVQMAIGTLSFSEIEAVIQIFKELVGNEGILVASRIADQAKITRSVIVNALRKLESAGVIESRSLGMKGTHIKVLNSKFYEELAKLS